MQSNVIDASSQKHTIKPYRFKVLNTRRDNEENANISNEKPSKCAEQANAEQINAEQIDKESTADTSLETTQVITPAIKQPEPQEPQSTQNSQPSFIEELLKRTDELSDNIIKLQMKIESQESEFKQRLASETDKARKEGEQAGEQAAKTAYDAQIKDLESKYSTSIKKLDEQSARFDEFLAKTQEQLSHTAIDIAKEVVLKEIKENSAKVALNIAKSLISELKDAASVEIKVNSKDYGYLSEQFEGDMHIKLSSDDAISPGGALLLSDSGNIDGTINTRFEKIRKILSE